MLSKLQKRLLNDYQRDFPLSSQPYRDIAGELGVSEAEVLVALQELTGQGLVSRVGPVIAPNRVGSSALVAMRVSPERLQEVAELISRYPEVNHNYEREHHYNLWFVLIASDRRHLQAVLADIEKQTAVQAMLLPMLADYGIDLGFDFDFDLEWHDGSA